MGKISSYAASTACLCSVGLDRSILKICEIKYVQRIENLDIIFLSSPVGDVQLCSWKLVLTGVGHGGHLYTNIKSSHIFILLILHTCVYILYFVYTMYIILSIYIFYTGVNNMYFTYDCNENIYLKSIYVHISHRCNKIPCSGWSQASSCSN